MQRYQVHRGELFDEADREVSGADYPFVYLATDVQALAARCIDPVEELLENGRIVRASYAGYAERQRRYDNLIAEDEALLAELRAIVEGK